MRQRALRGMRSTATACMQDAKKKTSARLAQPHTKRSRVGEGDAGGSGPPELNRYNIIWAQPVTTQVLMSRINSSSLVCKVYNEEIQKLLMRKC